MVEDKEKVGAGRWVSVGTYSRCEAPFNEADTRPHSTRQTRGPVQKGRHEAAVTILRLKLG